MSSIVTCYLPADLASSFDPGAGRSAWARGAISAALDESLEPVAPALWKAIETTRASISFDRVTHQRLVEAGRVHDAAPGQIAGRLILALERQKQADSAEPAAAAPADVRKSPFDTLLRPEQARMLSSAEQAIDAGKIAFVEGGTGVGKSRVIALLAERSAASQRALPPGARRATIVAAPTIAILTHLIEEWRLAAPASQTRVCVTLGRGQFVSASALSDLLDETMFEDDEATEPGAGAGAQAGRWPQARAWLRQGMPTGQCPSTRVLASIHPGIVGLAADLQAVEPTFPVEQALLTSDEDPDEEEEACWRALRAHAQEAEIVFAAHAMVAADTLQRARAAARRAGQTELLRDGLHDGLASAKAPTPGILPDRALLLIDEAHLYEDAQASIMSDGVSVFALRSALGALRASSNARQAGLARTAYEAADILLQKLRLLDEDLVVPPRPGTREQRAWASAQFLLLDLQAALENLLESFERKGKRRPLGVRERRARALGRTALRGLSAFIGAPGFDKRRDGRILRIQLSPTRRYPLLVFGPKSVRNQLMTLWSTTAAACLFSATLYLPTKANGVSARHMMLTLAAPQERAAFMAPAHAAWSLSTPLVLTPSDKAAIRLTPPAAKLKGDAFERTLHRWTEAQSEQIRRIAGDAAGGTLVLMTGFERAHALAEALAPHLGERLVEQTSSRSASACRAQFVALHRRGLRPVWIGVGAAWTGLDLRDETAGPEQDFLLTDLVVPNMFNMAKSSTDLDREMRFGFEAVRSKALFAFRQGIGRLMRRDGVLHRRLWVLDGRLARRDANVAQHRQILDAYRRRATFDVDGTIVEIAPC